MFVENGIAASTRKIAMKAGISEAVIYQRHPTKADLFFAAMVPPALNVEELLAVRSNELQVLEHLQEIAIGMMDYFRKLIPILLPLITHPSFDFEEFEERHPDSPLGRMRQGLMEYFENQAELGNIDAKNVGPASLTLFATLHSFAIFERLGVHGGVFDDAIIRAVVCSLWAGLAPKGGSESPS